VPHFTLQITSQGPMLNAFVAVSDARAAAMKAANIAIPSPIQIRALVDTGASCTCVDPSVMTSLGLTPTGTVPVSTPTTGGTPELKYQYDVALAIPGATQADIPLVLATIAVVEAELLAGQGFHALIGRDILSQCVLVYNGSFTQFTLAF
jgi:predicted aspartyl protease